MTLAYAKTKAAAILTPQGNGSVGLGGTSNTSYAAK